MTDDMKYTVFYTDENGQLVPNGEKLLSITEIAKYRNIPTERLRYYDKIGLLRPDYVDKLTGRRFYSAIIIRAAVTTDIIPLIFL